MTQITVVFTNSAAISAAFVAPKKGARLRVAINGTFLRHTQLMSWGEEVLIELVSGLDLKEHWRLDVWKVSEDMAHHGDRG